MPCYVLEGEAMDRIERHNIEKFTHEYNRPDLSDFNAVMAHTRELYVMERLVWKEELYKQIDLDDTEKSIWIMDAINYIDYYNKSNGEVLSND